MSDDKIVDIKSGKKTKVIYPDKFYKISGKTVIAMKLFADYILNADHSLPNAQMTILGYVTKFVGDMSIEKFEEIKDAETECQS